MPSIRSTFGMTIIAIAKGTLYVKSLKVSGINICPCNSSIKENVGLFSKANNQVRETT